MTSVWTRFVKSGTPLPQHFETSLRVAISVCQGRATLSISQLTRDGGRQARPRVLEFRQAAVPPETYGEAAQDLVEYLQTMIRALDCEGLG